MSITITHLLMCAKIRYEINNVDHKPCTVLAHWTIFLKFASYILACLTFVHMVSLSIAKRRPGCDIPHLNAYSLLI